MNTRGSLVRSGIALLLVVCLLAVWTPAYARVPEVGNLSSPTHPSEDAWYADDSPSFAWDDATGLPALLGTVATQQARGVACAGDYAYVADLAEGLKVINLKDPSAPTVVGTCAIPSENAWSVEVDGDYAYVACPSDYLAVIDISAPGSPILIGGIAIPEHPYSLEVEGDLVYVACQYAVKVVDVSDPGAPAVIGTFAPSVGQGFCGIEVVGDVAYVGAGDRLWVLDVSAPTTPTFVNVMGTVDRVCDIAVAGDTLYLAVDGFGLRIFDITVPTAPEYLGEYGTPGHAFGVRVSGDTAFIADLEEGLLSIDVHDPHAPRMLGRYHDGLVKPWGLDVDGEYACVADDSGGLRVFRIARPEVPALLAAIGTLGSGGSVAAIDGDRAFVGDDTGLHVLEAADPAGPYRLASLATTYTVTDIEPVGDLLYVVAGELLVLDVSTGSAPEIVGAYTPAERLLGVDVAGDVAYATGRSTTLHVLDLRDSTAPSLLAGDDYPAGTAYDVTVAGDVAYVANGDEGVVTYDVSVPAVPTAVGATSDSMDAREVEVAGDVAYVPDAGWGRLLVLDISAPESPALAGACEVGTTALDVAVAGDTAYVAADAGGLAVVDVSSSANPIVDHVVDLQAAIKAVTNDGLVGYAAGEGALLTLDLGLGVVAYSRVIDANADTVPDSIIDTRETTSAASGLADGTHYFHVRAVGECGIAGATAHRRVRIDTTAPVNPTIVSGSHTPGVWSNNAYIAITISGAIDAGSGVDGYSAWFSEGASSTPPAVKNREETVTYFGMPVSAGDQGSWYFNLRTVDNLGHWSGAIHGGPYLIDFTAPVTNDSAVATYENRASIALAAVDAHSGVDDTWFVLDGDEQQAYSGPIEVVDPGAHTLEYWSVDVAGNAEEHHTAAFEVVRTGPVDVVPLQGKDRFDTAVEVSKASFPDGADAVIIATGRNWPDALGGSSLAGALGGPILLVDTNSVSAAVAAEIMRLGAEEAVILGGTAAVGESVETALNTMLGDTNVSRISGATRYQTADAVAREVIRIVGPAYDGTAFVATGSKFPDALGAAPLAAANAWPLYLADPASGLSSETKASMDGVDSALVLGGTAVVSPEVETYLNGAYGDANVTRLYGADRYETAVKVATYGVDHAGLSWNRAAIATGANFPDALAGGVLQGEVGSVMLLTKPDTLNTYTRSALARHKTDISIVTFFGGMGALPQVVRDEVCAALQ